MRTFFPSSVFTLTFEPSERHSVESEHGAQIILILSPWPGQGEGYNPLPAVLGVGAVLVAIVAFSIGLRRMQRNAARFDGRSPMARPAAMAPQPPPSIPPSPSWIATDWSLPRDVDPPDDADATGRPTDPPPASLPTDPRADQTSDR